jgi:hypothetical protein
MPKRAKRCSDGEMVIRMSAVYDLIVEGATRGDIWQYVTRNTDWGISIRTLDRYIRKATKQIEKDAEFIRAREMGKAVRRLNKLYNKTSNIKDYGICLNIQKETNKLFGLYPDKKVNIDPGDSNLTIIIGSPDDSKDEE